LGDRTDFAHETIEAALAHQTGPSRGLTTEPMLWSDGVNSWKHGLIFSSRKADFLFTKA